MKNDALFDWLALNSLGFISLTRWEKLKTYLHQPGELFRCSQSTLKYFGFTELQTNAIQKFSSHQLKKDLDWLEKQDHHIVTFDMPQYPERLKNIAHPPLLLYVAGNADCLKKKQLGMVGCRKPTPMGEKNAYHFAQFLVQCGLSICSGLAYGIDAASHKGALTSGETIAVVGTGLDIIYPKMHVKLAETIQQQGALVSEFPIGTGPNRLNFPRRNRLISGLSLGVLVIEATLHSGSLITAKYALDQGREVFAMPGSIHNVQSKGCHQLIREGAVLTETVTDILNELGGIFGQLKCPSSQERLDFDTLDDNDRLILKFIGDEASSVDQLIGQTGLPVEVVTAGLLNLELSQTIKVVAGGFARAAP